MWLIILAGVVALLVYLKWAKPAKYWEEKGVPNVQAHSVFGNMREVFFQQRACAYVVDDVYKQFSKKSPRVKFDARARSPRATITRGQQSTEGLKGALVPRYFGFHLFSQPVLMIRDPDLIKQITVKEFDTFPEHREFIVNGVDDLWSNNLFAMRGGQKWHEARSTLSPSFTSNKMRMMFDLMRNCSTQFVDHFLKQNKMVTVEMKDAFTRFTNDVIATTAFGVTCDSLRDRENEFYLMGIEATDFTGIKGFFFIVHVMLPTLAKLLKLQVFSKRVGRFFSNIIKETIKLREERGIFRPDMIHLLMEAKKGNLKNDRVNDLNTQVPTPGMPETEGLQKLQKSTISDNDITAHALIFFFAGFESVARMLCFGAYELAANADVQEKLREEVDKTLKKYNNEFTYEAIMEMKYLDMVISETLRLWPPFVFNDRQAVKPYTIEPQEPGEQSLQIKPGTICIIPTYSVQRDPEHFPNPNKFDPERFSAENKHNINPFIYQVFGAGPRNCIGSRFALLEGKLILAEIISKFEIVPVEKTQIPLKLDRKNFNLQVEGGSWLGLKPRNMS